MTGTHNSKRRSAAVSLILRLAGTAAALALLFYFLPVDELWSAIRRVPPAVWLVVFAGYMAAHGVGVTKWRLMVNVAGAGLNVSQAARCYFAGLFGNIFLPSLIGGDVIRAGLALKMGRSKAGVLLGSLVDRILDIFAITCIAVTGALLAPGALDAQSRRVFVVLAMVFVAGAIAVSGLLLALPGRKFSWRNRRRLVKLRRAGRAMARQPQRVALAVVLGATFQVSLILLMARLAPACGLEVPLRAWLFAYPLAKLAALVPVTQGGIGVREAALAALLVPFGAPAVLTVAVGLVWETIVIAGGLAGGAYSFGLAGGREKVQPRMNTD
jgi:uncharacterized protein (TIRG00374 family)